MTNSQKPFSQTKRHFPKSRISKKTSSQNKNSEKPNSQKDFPKTKFPKKKDVFQKKKIPKFFFSQKDDFVLLGIHLLGFRQGPQLLDYMYFTQNLKLTNSQTNFILNIFF